MAGFIALIFFGGFSLFGYFSGSMFIFYFILGFAVVCFLIMFIMFIFFRVNEKKRKSKEKVSDYEAVDAGVRLSQRGLFSRVFPTTNEEIRLNKNTEADPIVIYNIQPITKAPPGSKCMISKLNIKPEDDVVQCLNCNSYFIKDYIIEWLKNHENCPVCQTILRMS
jgi:hypothetical protein